MPGPRPGARLLAPCRSHAPQRCVSAVSLGTKARLPLTPTYPFRVLAALAVVGLACHCGSSAPAPNTIIISNYQYSPANLSVKPGTTITVSNQDSMTHSLTSENVMNAFASGAVDGVQFDTGAFLGNTTFTIPTTATAGTVIPYFCTVHLTTMGQGEITILAP